MTRESKIDRRSVGVRYWRSRDAPLALVGLALVSVVVAIHGLRGDSDA